MLREEVVTTCDRRHQADTPGRPVGFSIDGVDYTVDLCETDEAELLAAARPFIEVAQVVKAQRTRAGRKPRTATDRLRAAGARAWAKAHGIEVGDRGRVPASVVAQYEAATSA